MKYIKQYKINEDTKIELTESYINDVLQVLTDEGIKYTIAINHELTGEPYIIRFQHMRNSIHNFLDTKNEYSDKTLILYENLKFIIDKILGDGFGSVFNNERFELIIFSKNKMHNR